MTTVDNMCADLLNWHSLYLAGRMHKPLRIIKDDARVRLTQQVNLTSAVRAALLTLPASFSERALFERVAGISYAGDPRMLLPAENRGKVGNIVRAQAPQFRELYHRLVTGLPGVHWPAHAETIEQDTSGTARAAHLKKLPSKLLAGVTNHYTQHSSLRRELDQTAYWVKLAEDARLPQVIHAGSSQYPLLGGTADFFVQRSATSCGTPRRCRRSRASSVRASARACTTPRARSASGGRAPRRRSRPPHEHEPRTNLFAWNT